MDQEEKGGLEEDKQTGGGWEGVSGGETKGWAIDRRMTKSVGEMMDGEDVPQFGWRRSSSEKNQQETQNE